MVFERGPCVFVFNFHPCNSYTDYLIGHQHNEPLRIVLDTDEGWFGGFQRLEYGHGNSFPPGQGTDNRYHSSKIYAPSRTAQVLVRESLLQGGITVLVDKECSWPCSISQLRLEVITEGKPAKGIEASGGAFQIDQFNATINVCCETRTGLQKLSGPFKMFFPGKYMLRGPAD